MAERLIALGFMEDVLERFPVLGSWRGCVRHLRAKLSSAGFAALSSPARAIEAPGTVEDKALSEELP